MSQVGLAGDAEGYSEIAVILNVKSTGGNQPCMERWEGGNMLCVDKCRRTNDMHVNSDGKYQKDNGMVRSELI